ncbi:hypothetical protein [Picrophilus oshimae]|uniref:Uncharacterized protein n=1 Tax=Picrophilus torridus (strain ATCC 700027 / DSM 9790 / JCM 10055 / NBRC 100828 / KAW 2/3) TaxID=1122961 RepID=A0A8G2FWC4_PICTO|nr:hypothetical protein [Picrophilus oshimae]SMD30669.1 hypothetical protein SAMN02745355_0563 [Picrophilus oshimae DSM 9789]
MRLKSNSRENEEKFLSNLKSLLDNPQVMIPDCDNKSILCPIKKYQKLLNQGNFKKSSNFISAFHECKMICDDNRAPLMGIIKTNYGSVPYCKRGNTDETVLAGVQNYNNDVFRLLAFKDVVSKNISVFSTRHYFTAKCKDGPDISIFMDILDEEGINYKVSDNNIIIGSSGEKMHVKYMGTSFIIYQDFKGNLFYYLFKHILTNDMKAEINIDFLKEIDIDPDDYVKNNKNTNDFIEGAIEYKKRYVVSNNLYAIGDKIYTINDFCNELNIENNRLIELISRHGIYLEDKNVNKLYELLFKYDKNSLLKSMFNVDDNDIKNLHGDYKSQIEQLKKLIESINIDRELPEPWSENSSYLISIIKEYRLNGREHALSYGERHMDNYIKKAIYCAFTESMGENRLFMFSDNEIILGKRIRPYIDDLISGNKMNINELKNIIM